MSAPTITVKGIPVPRLGFGTWQITGRECEESVRDALEIGYRHVDTARVYDNEEEVGAGIRASGVPREEIFLATKVWMDDAAPRDVAASAEGSLRRLGVDHVDLLMLHWPNARVPLEDTLRAFEELRAAGRTRLIGVSNFPPGMLRRALAIEPGLACDQVEMHPFLGQDALLEIAREADLMVTAYAPLAHGKAVGDAVLREIGATHGASAAQVAIAWLLGIERVVVIPKASSHDNRVACWEAQRVQLSAEERARIDALPKDQRDFDPGWAPDWGD